MPADFSDLPGLREEYAAGGLDEGQLTPDPFDLFRTWLSQLREAGIYDPTAMVLSTVSDAGAPSSRMVLLKGVVDGAFCFYTHHDSRKGRELAGNPRCSLLFPWNQLQRQVRIDGVATRLSRADAEAYFAGRPRESQLGAWASHQSAPVSSRAELQREYDEAVTRFHGVAVPCPDGWGGYAVRPETVEFWQGRLGRMHDRLVYHRAGAQWHTERLAP